MNKNNKRKKTVGVNKQSSSGFGDIGDDDNDDPLDDIFMSSSNSIHHPKKIKDESSDELPHKNSKTRKQSTTCKNNNITTNKSKPKQRIQTKQSKDNQPVTRVPNPPKSLIQLLQKDTKVMKYFTALQQNLEYDVQTWRDKALSYRREYKILQKKISQQEQGRLTNDIPEIGNGSIDNDVVNNVHEKESSHLPIDTIHVTVPAHTQNRANNISQNTYQNHFSQDQADQSSLSAPEDEQPSNKKNTNNNDTTRKNITLAEDTLFDEFPSSSSSATSVNSNDSSHSLNNEFMRSMEDECNKPPKTEATKNHKTLKHTIDANRSYSPLNDNYNHHANHEQLDKKLNQTSTYANILPLLIKAYDTLEQHGVWVVNVKYVKTKNTCIINKDTTTNHGHDDIGTNNHSFDRNEPQYDCTVQDDNNNNIDNSNNARDTNDKHVLINERTVDFAHPEYLDDSDDSSDLPSSFLPSISPRNKLLKLTPQNDTTSNHKQIISPSLQNNSQVHDISKINIGQDLDSYFNNNEMVIFSRRSDTDVITDLLRSIRSSIRLPTLEIMKINDNDIDGIVQNDIRSLFQPFISQKLIPCCYKYAVSKLVSEQQHYMKSDDDENKQESIFDNVIHPAANSLHSLTQALAIIDLYCTENSLLSEDEHWNDLFDTSLLIHDSDFDDQDMKTKLKKIKVGFRHRNIVEPLVQSLYGEISRYWSIVDRGARNTSSTLLYEQDNVEQDSSSSFDIDSLLVDEDELKLDMKNQIQSMDSEHTHESSLFPCVLTTKIHIRLFTLVERIYHCRVVAYMYHFKHQTEDLVQLIFEYILASAPVPYIEMIYPRFPPIMSMCILEALLGRPDETFLNPESSWFRNSLLQLSLQEKNSQSLIQSIAVIIHRSAALWSERLKSQDDRIRDISKVEVAAYKRLLISEGSWLNQDFEGKYEDNYELIVKRAMSSLSGMIDRISNADENDPIVEESSSTPEIIILSLTFQISLLCSGNIQMIQKTYDQIYGYFRTVTRGVSLLHLAPVMTACIHAYSGVQMLQWESMALKATSSTHKIADFHIFKDIQRWIDQWLGAFVEEFKSTELHEDLSILYHILRCCLVISDAPRAQNIVKLMSNELHSQNKIDQSSVKRKIIGILNEIKIIANIPTLRVINLEYRRDRLNSFMIQAKNTRIMTALAISDLDLEVDSNDSSVWGSHAYDGRNVNHLEFENNWKNLQGSSNKRLADYVQTHWRPNDLIAFDIGARDDDALVRVSPTERACALSHISSWLGVKRSLDDFHYLNSEIKSRNLVEPAELFHNFIRLYKISGFAKGRPLMVENEDMPPSPVCIIVEDDAVFVDRFTDILNQVLDELPRDFHFCSIGYGRPKTAPMVKYSEQIGIPSCLWYLSGYILSYEGAKYLLDSLPVIGPVDSWIGLKMTSTWDNKFGHRIGVGHKTKVLIDQSQLPSRKELQSIMKFRCFASITPLCSQKLGSSSTISSSEKERVTWRDRDTDITFSGRMTVTK